MGTHALPDQAIDCVSLKKNTTTGLKKNFHPVVWSMTELLVTTNVHQYFKIVHYSKYYYERRLTTEGNIVK